jgi:hypothetical protein
MLWGADCAEIAPRPQTIQPDFMELLAPSPPVRSRMTKPYLTLMSSWPE